MNTKSKAVAELAANLAGIPEIRDEVELEILAGSLVSHLLALRVSKGLTQEQIAEKMGCDPSKVSRLEGGNDLNVKWVDVLRYTSAMNLGITVLFEDPSIPAAERIKNCVYRISDCLEELTALAAQVGADDKIAKRIHEFSGEVLLNFLMRYKDHSDKLRAVVKVQPKRQIVPCVEEHKESAKCDCDEGVLA